MKLVLAFWPLLTLIIPPSSWAGELMLRARPMVASQPLTKKHSLTLIGRPYKGPRYSRGTLRSSKACWWASKRKSTTQLVSSVAAKARAFFWKWKIHFEWDEKKFCNIKKSTYTLRNGPFLFKKMSKCPSFRFHFWLQLGICSFNDLKTFLMNLGEFSSNLHLQCTKNSKTNFNSFLQNIHFAMHKVSRICKFVRFIHTTYINFQFHMHFLEKEQFPSSKKTYSKPFQTWICKLNFYERYLICSKDRYRIQISISKFFQKFIDMQG